MTSASAGYSGTPLSRKLGIKEGSAVATFGAPANFASLLAPLPAGVQMTSRPAGNRRYDVLVAFVRSEGELRERFAAAQPLLVSNGGLWIAWPKKTSALASTVREADVRNHGLAQGLVDNKVCAIDADWSGLRFVIRKENRPPGGRS